MTDRRIRTVEIELLRSGPPHNQLLSPVTRYLGMSANSAAADISVPYEHAELLRLLENLRYGLPSGSSSTAREQAQRNRKHDLAKLSEAVTDLLVSVPGVTRAAAPCDGDADEMIHVELIISASELALLPFELCGPLESPPRSNADYLLLSSRPAFTLTRRVRRVSGQGVKWPTDGRILFIAAGPEGMDIPYKEHLDHLLRALQPWLPRDDSDSHKRRYFEALNRTFRVLKDASIEDVTRACEETPGGFSHVHILAHGVPDPSSPGRAFGLAFHDPSDKDRKHVISGAQLASALQLGSTDSRPQVVTLATCDGGHVSDVVHTGASIAHDLHRAGIAFVVASQFPLTFRGSVTLVDTLYSGLLCGEDPRELLSNLRRKLHSLYAGETHDWASLVAYAALPPDLDVQLAEVRYKRVSGATDNANTRLEALVEAMKRRQKTTDEHVEKEHIDSQVDPLLKLVDFWATRLPTTGKYHTEGVGLRAAAAKRKAQALFEASRHATGELKTELQTKSTSSLRQARLLYREAAEFALRKPKEAQMVATHWVLTQAISLDIALGQLPDLDWWTTAKVGASMEANRGEGDDAIWGHGTLIELYLQRSHLDPATHEDSRRYALEHVTRLIALAGAGSNAVRSAHRQLERYRSWWWEEEGSSTTGIGVSDESMKLVVELVCALSSDLS